MIVRIHKSSSGMGGALRYNESKVRRGVASILCEHGIGSTDQSDINRVFRDRERMSLREAEHLSFQMSVNPGVEDSVTEERIPDLVRDLMEGLGYGRQPWVVFRHEDTGRIHYHVVSVRIDSSGRKIADWYEKKECDRLVVSLEEKYGFVKGRGASNAAEKGETIPVFRPGEGDVVKSLERCVRHALSYVFSTERLFSDIMLCHGVLVQEGLDPTGLRRSLAFQGIGRDGRPCTSPISETRLGIDVGEAVKERISATSTEALDKTARDIVAILTAALARCPDMTSLTSEIKKRHVDLTVYRDGGGKTRDAAVIDHEAARAFSVTALPDGVAASILALADSKDRNDTPEAETIREDMTNGTPPLNSGVTEALATFLEAAIPSGSGQKGRRLEDTDKKKRKRRR